MLILAGVTINLTIGENGIFKTAQLAAKNYTNAQEKELADLAEFNNTLNEEIKGEEKQITELTLNKTVTTITVGTTETLIVTISPDNASNKSLTWESSNTDVATVSEGTITAVALGTATITATAKDGSGKSASCNVTVEYPTLASKVRPGDYVEYTGNGYTKWQVLYNDDTYGLQIISSGAVSSYTLSGVDDYNNAVNLLNTECRKYVNTLYSKDANSGRCVGSNPLNPDDSAGYITYNGRSMKNADKNYITDYEAMQAATSQNSNGIHIIDRYYFMASRQVFSNTFHMMLVGTDGRDYNHIYVCYVDSNGNWKPNTMTYGVRAVVSLKSELLTVAGDGSESMPYKLVAK